MLIDITKFMIINQEQFENIISQFNCSLSINDNCYLITYLFTNFLAYVFLFLFLWLVFYLYNKIFSSKKGWF